MRFVGGVIPACLAVGVLQCFFSDIHACSCLINRSPPLLQEIFCYSDFVFEFVPIRSETEAKSYRVTMRIFWGRRLLNGRRYHINTTKVYKTSPEYESLSQKHVIYTRKDSASCGVHFRKGTKYTVLGNVSEGKISTYSCGHRGMRSDPLTPYQIVQLESGYSQNCNKCQIQHCSNPKECDQLQTNNRTCLSSLSCFYKHALCHSVNDGNYSRCQWDDDNGRLHTCLQRSSTQNPIPPEYLYSTKYNAAVKK